MITGIAAADERMSTKDDMESQKAAVAMLRKREMMNKELKSSGPTRTGKSRFRARIKNKAVLSRTRGFTETEAERLNLEK